MKVILTAVAASSLLLLGACGGKGDDKLGDQVEQSYDNKADALDAAAENASGATEESLETQADATRAEGERKEEAIDDSDVNADAMTPGEKANVANSM